MSLDHVVWIGGGCGAGKSTLARRLAYRLDLRLYPVDAYAYAHEARATAGEHPFMVSQRALDYETRHVLPTAEEKVAAFVTYAAERFRMVLDDLRALAGGPLVLAEGPFMLPELVAPVLASPGHGLWLLPTPAFTARNLAARETPRDDRAHRTRLAATSGSRRSWRPTRTGSAWRR
ncbi:hypothetical protein R8Z50_17770 [Longispora sp. K20-0274]|uniref:hypothetical protein n=1 Tax=Longispora sp. K20-0274 TaxID=3088255 RepID=UPI0039999443